MSSSFTRQVVGSCERPMLEPLRRHPTRFLRFLVRELGRCVVNAQALGDSPVR